jgi:hypothetical protein
LVLFVAFRAVEFLPFTGFLWLAVTAISIPEAAATFSGRHVPLQRRRGVRILLLGAAWTTALSTLAAAILLGTLL